MEFFTDYLLELKRTDKRCMKVSSEEQHDNFAQQLSALEKLLIISYSRMPMEELHKNLKLMLKAGSKGMLKITSLEALQECIDFYTKTVKGEEAENVIEFFRKFFDEVEYLKKVKHFFHETIYHCLYEYFYDPLLEDSDDEYQQEDISDDDGEKTDQDMKSRTPSPTPAQAEKKTRSKTKTQQPQPKPKKAAKKTDVKEKNKNGKAGVKKKKRRDNRLKVLERIQKEKAAKDALLANQKLDEPKTGREFERLKHKTDKQRLAFATQQMFEIQKKWNHLISPGVLRSSDFDEDSLKDLRPYKNYIPFEPVFRLLPDLLVKGFKLVELSKIWYNSNRRLVGPVPAEHRTVKDFSQLITQMDDAIQRLEDEVEEKKSMRSVKQHERRLLLNQLMRLDQLKEKHDNCVEKEKELKSYYKQLKQERNKEYPKLDKLQRDDPDYRVVYDQIQYLAESMKSTYRELQTTSYELALVKQDLDVEMGNRSNIIHMQNDTKQSVTDMHDDIANEEQQLTKYSHTRERLKENCNRMQMALYASSANSNMSRLRDKVPKSKQTGEPINKTDVKHSKNSHTPRKPSEEVDTEMEQELEQTLNQGENLDLERASTTDSDNSSTPSKPLPPLDPRDVSAPNNEYLAKKPSRTFNPTSSGITDSVEAKDYDDRVKRLQKDFEFDFSDLKTTVDCGSPTEFNTMESGDEADMESDHEVASRPHSKKLVKRIPDRYSPLSAASDSEEYIYRQPYPATTPGPVKSNPPQPKTIYILKKSSPKKAAPPPRNVYILTKSSNTSPETPDAVQQMKPPPHNTNVKDTLSIYKKSQLPGLKHSEPGDFLKLEPPQQYPEGMFTPYKELSDGDITIDSGTGNSLDSQSEEDRDKSKPNAANEMNDYKHKPRRSVREQLALTKHAQRRPVKDAHVLPRERKPIKSKLPTFNASNAPVKRTIKYPPSNSSSNNDAEKDLPLPMLNDRHTLSIEKPAHQRHVREAVYIPKDVRRNPKIPLQRQVRNKPTQPQKQSHIPFYKKALKQPVRRAQHVRILESPSDDDTNEIFKQSSVRHLPQPKAQLQPQSKSNMLAHRQKRGNNGLVRLGKVY